MADQPRDETDAGSGGSLFQRLSAAFPRSTRPKDETEEPAHPLTDAEIKARITKIDDRERKFSYIAAALGALLVIVWFFPYLADPKKRDVTTASPVGHGCPAHYVKKPTSGHAFQCLAYTSHTRFGWIAIMLVVLIFPLAIWITAMIGRRALLGFTTLMTGFAIESTLPGANLLGLPFLFLGGWLLVRAWRVQRYGTVNAKEAAEVSSARRAEKKAGGTPAKSGSAVSAKSPVKDSKGASSSGTASKSKVDPSKRYTPKAPPKKKTTR